MLGSRRNMEDKLTLEYFLSLLDEGERILSGDKFGERHQIVDYELKEKQRRRRTLSQSAGVALLGEREEKMKNPY